MATTTNYGWTTPDDTDLVKDGAAAIRTLGSEIDTTTENLNPSTTEGDIEYRSSTADTNARLAIGTAGQVLTVNSGATAPEWATASSGGMTLISSGSLTGAAVTVSSIPATYKHLMVKMFNGYPATNGNYPAFRFNGDTGATQYYAGGYKMPSGAGFGIGPASYGGIALEGQNSSSYYLANSTVIANYASTTSYKICTLNFLARGSSDFITGSGTMYWKSLDAIDSITMQNEGGTVNWGGGTYEIYGVN
jgi:hypothetical protein